MLSHCALKNKDYEILFQWIAKGPCNCCHPRFSISWKSERGGQLLTMTSKFCYRRSFIHGCMGDYLELCMFYLLEREALVEERVEGLPVYLRLKLAFLVRHQVDLKQLIIVTFRRSPSSD
jgi:hypothetical protein